MSVKYLFHLVVLTLHSVARFIIDVFPDNFDIILNRSLDTPVLLSESELIGKSRTVLVMTTISVSVARLFTNYWIELIAK